MANMHYCKLAEDCNWCSVPFCPYEKDDEPFDESELEIMYKDDKEEWCK